VVTPTEVETEVDSGRTVTRASPIGTLLVIIIITVVVDRIDQAIITDSVATLVISAIMILMITPLALNEHSPK
jgi:hypothetical protein